ncbi:MAG: MFS transporter [Alphaproteobacteria bacterium]|jgi:FSR family fosmidomycin resistance protein-like MFS transporter|nr:MFS transporter [Rhodospirillaceae bacterium]MDP6020769.1 MFS transporter [Alphaproteobacteria bacterium]MDP6257033.1 MFS transporter [Alphaproteobacteria bacterium]MDP7056416.1 MFS transporter [Alphaproteobacteria bacterium]MDP7230216.1 MFS transporter [Alphaproteobacteria bacterium]|tara:strand:+ start:6126 stop:7304 length:1179 start_codon:yes stop_codon:yes gene_type:complete
MKPNLLVAFSIGHCANDLVPIAMYILIPAFGTAMGLSPAEIGLLFMLHSLGASLAYLPAGLLADHVANRGVLLAATFFWVGFGYMMASFVDGFWAFAIVVSIAGMGDAAWHPIATGVLTQMHRARRAYALGVHAIGGHFSQTIALPAAGLLLALWDWHVAMRVLAVPTLLMGCAFIFISRHVPRHVNSRPTRADFTVIWQVWTTKAGLRMIALFIAYNMGLFAIIAMTPLYLKANHGLGWLETALVMAAMMLVGALAQPWTGKISDNVGRRPLIILGNGIAAGASLFAWLTTDLVLTVIALCVTLNVLVAIRAVLLAAALDHAGGREGTSLGLAFAAMEGFAASAAVMAGLAGESDLANAFLLACAFSLVALVLAVATPKQGPASIRASAAE